MKFKKVNMRSLIFFFSVCLCPFSYAREKTSFFIEKALFYTGIVKEKIEKLETALKEGSSEKIKKITKEHTKLSIKLSKKQKSSKFWRRKCNKL